VPRTVSAFFLKGKGIFVLPMTGFGGSDGGSCGGACRGGGGGGVESSSSPSSGDDGAALFAALSPSGEPEACLFVGGATIASTAYGRAGRSVKADISNIFSYILFLWLYRFIIYLADCCRVVLVATGAGKLRFNCAVC
jgi:hypothetical protein